MTHSLFHPVGPPTHGPDPADVALFPLDTAPPAAPADLRSPATPDDSPPDLGTRHRPHRRPRHRARVTMAASGVVAAVAGCAALTAALFGGQDPSQDSDDGGDGPTLAMPDGGLVPDQDQDSEDGERSDGSPSPDPTVGADSSRRNQRSSSTPSPSASNTSSPRATDTADSSGGSADSGGSGDTEGTGDWPTSSPSFGWPGYDPGANPSPGLAADPGGTATVLREGDQGAEVVELQERLLQLDWLYTGGAYGRYDEETREAVARFQEAYGVQGDREGVYGPHTRAVLEAHTVEP